jgi:hypothetical protein
MRRWALVLCFIGVMGGGCSARSLLTIELSTDDGTAVRGTPLIQVTQNGRSVRTVERDTYIDLGSPSGTSVGIYLDGDVSGAVKVEAKLRAENDCQWRGSSASVDIRSGGRASVAVALSANRADCRGPRPDAGTDAGDGGKDAGPTLLGDGGDGTMGVPVGKVCGTYCSTYLERCKDWGGAGTDQFECVTQCLRWHRENVTPPDGGGDILTCLDRYVRATENPDAANLCAMCPLASPESEACGLGPGRTNACLADGSADGS